MLVVIVLKERVIRAYASLLGTTNRDPSNEIHKLVVMLPIYLSDNGFFERTKCVDWQILNVYKDKLGQRTQILNQHPFDVQYVENIAQQACASLYCGVFVVGYAEILSEGLTVPSSGFDAQTQRIRYATLL